MPVRAKNFRPLLAAMVPGEQYSEDRLLEHVQDRSGIHCDAAELKSMLFTADWRVIKTLCPTRGHTWSLSLKYLNYVTYGTN